MFLCWLSILNRKELTCILKGTELRFFFIYFFFISVRMSLKQVGGMLYSALSCVLISLLPRRFDLIDVNGY